MQTLQLDAARFSLFQFEPCLANQTWIWQWIGKLPPSLLEQHGDRLLTANSHSVLVSSVVGLAECVARINPLVFCRTDPELLIGSLVSHLA
jgi:hypothetical protein